MSLEEKAIRWSLLSEGEEYGQSILLASSSQRYPWMVVYALRELANSLEKTIEKYDIKRIEEFQINTKEYYQCLK